MKLRYKTIFNEHTYSKMLEWREAHITEKHFVLLLSFMVGAVSAFAAVLLKSSIHLIQHWLDTAFVSEINYWYLISPAIGIAIASVFVRKVVKDDISHGITRILFAISQRKSILKLHNTWSSLVGSSITIGFGGSVGAEAPIVLTGAAIGSNLAKFFKMNQKTMMLMIGCGAAGAIGGIFKAPIAGLVFTLEVLMLDLTMTSVAPLLISSVTATSIAYVFTGSGSMFQFSMNDPFSVDRIPYLMLLGIVCGLVSLYFTRGMNYLEGIFKQLKKPEYKMLLGGTMLGALVFLFPPLYGEGYDVIANLLNGNSTSTLDGSLFSLLGDSIWVLLVYLILVVFFKIFASAATNGGGGVGGIFAPSLFVGSVTGFIVARLLNLMGCGIPEANFVLAGMSGLMSGVMHAPLTGIFLIAELTGGYDLFMTLMVVSVSSYITILFFEPHSLYSMRLAQKGELLTHHKDRAVLTLLKMDNVIETDLTILHPAMTLGELVKVISHSRRNLFPVVDVNSKRLLGILLLDEVRNIMFRPELYDRFTVGELMISPPAILDNSMPMEKVMETFEDTGAWNLPVVDEHKVYLGFVSKSKIFNSYRSVLVHFSDD